MLLPIAHMGHGQLLHESAEIAVPLGPKHEVPVIRKQTIGADPHGATLQRLFDTPLEGLEITLLLE